MAISTIAAPSSPRLDKRDRRLPREARRSAGVKLNVSRNKEDRFLRKICNKYLFRSFDVSFIMLSPIPLLGVLPEPAKELLQALPVHCHKQRTFFRWGCSAIPHDEGQANAVLTPAHGFGLDGNMLLDVTIG
jgi:hypothetical protein